MTNTCLQEADALEESDPVSIPTYEEFCGRQDDDNDWWGRLLEGESEWLMETYGIEVKSDDIYFDLYHQTCSSDGRIYDQDKFIAYFHDQLMSASPTMTEILRDGMFTVRWTGGGRSGMNAYDDISDFSDNGYVFSSGIFAGMEVDELLEAEGNEAIDEWHDVALNLVNSIHMDILKALECEDEQRKSPEEYEEWIKENYTP